MSPSLQFLYAMERLHSLDETALADSLGPSASAFMASRWIVERGHLTHVMAPCLDDEDEVAVEIDRDAGVYRYRSFERAGRIVVRPLADITLYGLDVDTWLDELSQLIGVEERRRSVRRMRVRDYLWHLGEVRIAGTHEFVPVFLMRGGRRAPLGEVASALADPVWCQGGVVLCRSSAVPAALAKCGHAVRGLEDFLCEDAGREVFDAAAFDRVLRGHVSPAGELEPVQFLNGRRLKLPHFAVSRDLSAMRARIVQQMWGHEGQMPPVKSWKEVNQFANTSYRSFEDAFASKAELGEVIERVAYGKYRLRRDP